MDSNQPDVCARCGNTDVFEDGLCALCALVALEQAMGMVVAGLEQREATP